MRWKTKIKEEKRKRWKIVVDVLGAWCCGCLDDDDVDDDDDDVCWYGSDAGERRTAAAVG
jgi:hypothetical protein